LPYCWAAEPRPFSCFPSSNRQSSFFGVARDSYALKIAGNERRREDSSSLKACGVAIFRAPVGFFCWLSIYLCPRWVSSFLPPTGSGSPCRRRTVELQSTVLKLVSFLRRAITSDPPSLRSETLGLPILVFFEMGEARLSVVFFPFSKHGSSGPFSFWNDPLLARRQTPSRLESRAFSFSTRGQYHAQMLSPPFLLFVRVLTHMAGTPKTST